MKVKITYGDKNPEVWRQAKVKLDPQDTWSLDGTLAEIIIPCLKQLKETTHGYPSPLYDENDEEGGFERWKKILDKMIYSFEAAKDGYWKDDKCMYNVDEIQEGFDLFGKYYMNLWD